MPPRAHSQFTLGLGIITAVDLRSDRRMTIGSGSRRRRWPVVVLDVLAVIVVAVGVLLLGALSVPGNQSLGVKLDEWGRDHRLGPEISWVERLHHADQRPAGAVKT